MTPSIGQTIDLNCDLGEGCGHGASIVPLISSANISCGAHAGDADTIRETLRLCAGHGVAAGCALTRQSPGVAIEQSRRLVDAIAVSYTHLDVYKRQFEE